MNAGGQKAFEQVRPEIEGDFRRQQASAKFAEAAETFTNTVYEQSDSLKPAADKLKLQIRSADDVTRNGAPAAGPEAGVLANPKLLASLFSQDSIRSKRNTEAVEVGGNTLVSARLVDYKAPERKAFEAVEAEVRNALVEQESRRLAVEAGEARLKALREGAEASGFGAPTTVSRATDSKLLPAAVEAIFRADAEKLPAFAGANLGGVGYSVFQVTKVTLPDEKAVAEKRAAYRQQLAQLLAQQELNAYLDSLKARAKIERRLERLAPASSAGDTR